MSAHVESIQEQICNWIDQKHTAQPGEDKRVLVFADSACCHLTALSYLRDRFPVGDGVVYTGYEEYPCELISSFITYYDQRPTYRTGALLFHFQHEHTDPADGPSGPAFQVLLVSAWANDVEIDNTMIAIASVPSRYLPQWQAFQEECSRIANSAIPYRGRVYIVGGMDATFDATVKWEDIYLPPGLKEDILRDIDSFFTRGVAIYQRLNIKPFRKLLLAGVPGTGKTMLCSAIAHWGQQQGHFVVYVSGSNRYGAQFWKIHRALDMAASSEAPTIVIVEELDAYLDEESKAQLLNVLDGSESPENPHGTILIATTNHPESIDDRVMKRPGRLDRIFIIPEMQNEEDAASMLKGYLGEDWREEHKQIVPDLLGKPGAFIREVALYALTMAAYHGEEGLSVELLQRSLETLNEQIEAKDDFLTSHKRRVIGLAPDQPLRNGRMNRTD